MGCSGEKADPLPPPPPPAVVTVKPGPNLHYARDYPSLILLPDGRVAVIGGADPNAFVVPTIELFDPQSGQFTDAGSLVVPRLGAHSFLLADGRVMILCGSGDHGNVSFADIEVWDPVGKTSTRVGALLHPRAGGSIVAPLPDGKYFILGDIFGPEVLDPLTWTSIPIVFPGIPPLGYPAIGQTPTGDVVLAGGTNGSEALTGRWVYHWQTGIFESLSPLAFARWGAGSIQLNDGKWLLIGGGGNLGQPGLDSIESYSDPTGPRLGITQGATGGVKSVSLLLPDGRVLIAGGGANNGPFSTSGMTTTLVYNPAKGQSTTGDPLATGRWAHGAIRLKDGRVLVVGGTTGQGSLATTELLTIH